MQIEETIASVDKLRELYKAPRGVVAEKVIDHLDPHSIRFISLSPFCCIGTADAAGNHDVSPRGDLPGFVRVLDESRLLIPDRPGNNRVDSMRNLLEHPRIGMLFMIPGIWDTLRVNGRAKIFQDADALAESIVEGGKQPKSGLVVHVEEVFLHCGRALKRSRIWELETHRQKSDIPPLAEMIRGQIAGEDKTLHDELDVLGEETWMNKLY